MQNKNIMMAEEFDKKFDDGEDVSEFLDLKNAERPGLTGNNRKIDILSLREIYKIE